MPTRISSTPPAAQGHDRQDIHRLAARDRHVFAALMLAHGHGDGLVTGATRKSAHVLSLINHVFDASAEDGAVGVTALLHKGRIVLIADTLVHEWPEAEDLATIAQPGRRRGAQSGAGAARGLRVLLDLRLSGVRTRQQDARGPPLVLDRAGRFRIRRRNDRGRGAEPRRADAAYPFCRLTGPANILVVPARHSASISVKLMQEMAGATVIGPILTGVTKPIQICSTNSTVNDILNMASWPPATPRRDPRRLGRGAGG
jgi:malate dehydrogenase (oxaloacetate-decarboxylating)(NADP+)